MNFIRNIFRTEGRFDRLVFFFYFLFTDIFGSIALIIGKNINDINPFLIAFLIIIYLALLWIWICALIKRFHDLNKSGNNVLSLIIPIYNIYLLLILFFKRGTIGVNDYGYDPVYRESDESRKYIAKEKRIKLDDIEKFVLKFFIIAIILGIILSIILKARN